MPAGRPLLVRLSRVTKSYGRVKALRDMDLEIHQGDFCAVFGPNGAGKTTLLRVVAGLTEPTAGLVEFKGGERAGRGCVGYVSHQSLLYSELTGSENLVFYGRLHGIPDPSGAASDMLARMGLQEAADRRVRGFSRGMKQRLTLARAFLHQPDLLLLDEPYSGLDQHGSRLLNRILGGLTEQGRTVLMITHDLDQGLALCNRALIQSRGELVYQAGPEELEGQPFERLYFQVVAGKREGRPGAP